MKINLFKPIFNKIFKGKVPISAVNEQCRLGFSDFASQNVRAVLREDIWQKAAPNYQYLSQGRLSEYELKKLISTLTKKELEPCKIPSPPCRIGYSDSQSEKSRVKIREHLWDNLIPNYKELYSGRLSEFELKKMISSLTKPPKVEHEKLKYLNIFNLAQVQEDAYRGQSLVQKAGYLSNLKQAKIKRVIDLAGFEAYKNDCINEGLEYKRFIIDSNFWHNAAFKSEDGYVSSETGGMAKYYSEEDWIKLQENTKIEHRVESVRFIDKFIDFIETINKGNFYIGCSKGTTRTSEALILEQHFNPLSHQFSQLPLESTYIKPCMTALYKNLTDANKKRLKFTQEFEQNLKVKLGIKQY